MIKILLIILTFLIISCERDKSSPFGIASNKAPSGTDCSVNSFDGITSITDVRDVSVQLNWNVDGEGIGYGIFKKNGISLELVSSENKNTSSYTVTGLSADTNYEFLVRKLSGTATYDCNENYEPIQTAVQSSFASCYEMYNHYGGAIASGYYEIDADLAGADAPFNVYCEMDDNGGGWTRIFYHDVNSGVFANAADANEKNLATPAASRYSIFSKLANFQRAGKFEFWLKYPDLDGAAGGNLWTQTSNPTVASTISGYTAISIDNTGSYWGGLARSSASSTYIDGSPGSATWWYAIGSYQSYTTATTVPGPGVIVDEVVIYVR